MTSWEDEVLHDPDGVYVAAIFDDLQSDDPRIQYEASAGLYWLAHYRPECLQSWENELFDLLGSLQNFGLGSDPVLGTRKWVADAIGQYLREYPHRLQAVIDLLDTNDPRRRADAVLTLAACLQSRPTKFVDDDETRAELLAPLADRFDRVADYLDDEYAEIRPSAVLVLAEVTSQRPEKALPLVPRVVFLLEERHVGFQAVLFLREIALTDSETRQEITARLIDVLHDVEPSNLPELPAGELETLMATLQALAAITSHHPEHVKPAEGIVREISKTKYRPVRIPAMDVLDNLDSTD